MTPTLRGIKNRDPDGALHVTLRMLNLNFGVDTTGAEQLAGDKLRTWLDKAEDQLFLSLISGTRNPPPPCC